MPRERQKCGHDGCDQELPAEEEKIPPGWTVARIEEFGTKTIRTYYVYICPQHTLATTEKQTSLFGAQNP